LAKVFPGTARRRADPEGLTMTSLVSDAVASSEWGAAPPLSEAALSGTFWSFGLADHLPHASFMVLAPDGRIGNYQNANEAGWIVLGDKLALVSNKGVPTTVFDQAQIAHGEITALMGRVRLSGRHFVHVLQRVSHPAHPLHATPPEADRAARFLKRPSRPARPNLVVLRAGDTSLHTNWAKDIEDEERSWDLCISSYGADPGLVLDQAEYVTHQPHQRKFQAVHDLFYEGSPLWQYERVWFPDDDLVVGWGDINLMFHLAREYDLDLSQPSLLPVEGCFITHGITRQQPANVLRYVDFVEIMCPIFSARALHICLGSFRDSVSGFGLDHLWPALLGGGRTRMAVIDAMGVIHTRPIGHNYDVQSAIAEEAALLKAYHFVRMKLPTLAVAL
jgi:hypothetical protein